MLRTVLALCLVSFAIAAAAATPDAITPDGGRYYGPLVGGKLHGKGRLEWDNGTFYEGGFENGVMSGHGRLRDKQGNVWEGSFVNGQLEGKGKSSTYIGDYEGEFKHGSFHGQGVLKRRNGDVYEGGFADGLYEGRGTLTYARPQPDGPKKETGIWRYGSLPNEAERARIRANVETALYAQPELLERALASLKPREAGRINLYLLAVAGDGSQEVFRREVEYVQKEFAQRFGTAGRTVALVNSRSTVATAPMATVTSLRRALKAIAARMDLNEDILFLFMTSHGSHDHEFYLNENGMQLPGLRAPVLAQLLKESGIRWKVVVVSACYSGGFVAPLQDGRSLVITAARKDRASFGCADENDFTYFGRAYFKESLPKASSFQDAFHQAEALVREWELKDASEPAQTGAKPAKASDENQSFPQISSTAAVDAHLKRWWAQLSR